MAQRTTHLDTARKRLAQAQERLRQVGFLPVDVSMEIGHDGEVFWVRFERSGEMTRTTSVIGRTPRDVARWVDGYSAAVFALSYVTHYGGTSVAG